MALDPRLTPDTVGASMALGVVSVSTVEYFKTAGTVV